MIIALSGYGRSGKNTVAEIIKELQPHKRWKIVGFSHKLKEVASILTGIPPAFFENQQFKQSHIHGWDMTARELLQKLGTEGIREGVHPDAWVNALFTDYREGDNWIIVDCRFPNEAQRVSDYGGLIVRIHRGNPVNSHDSEIALDQWDFDYNIDNNADLQSLIESVKIFIKQKL